MVDSVYGYQDERIWAIIDRSNGIIKPDGQEVFSNYIGSQQDNRPILVAPMTVGNV